MQGSVGGALPVSDGFTIRGHNPGPAWGEKQETMLSAPPLLDAVRTATTAITAARTGEPLGAAVGLAELIGQRMSPPQMGTSGGPGTYLARLADGFEGYRLRLTSDADGLVSRVRVTGGADAFDAQVDKRGIVVTAKGLFSPF